MFENSACVNESINFLSVLKLNFAKSCVKTSWRKSFPVDEKILAAQLLGQVEGSLNPICSFPGLNINQPKILMLTGHCWALKLSKPNLKWWLWRQLLRKTAPHNTFLLKPPFTLALLHLNIGEFGSGFWVTGVSR